MYHVCLHSPVFIRSCGCFGLAVFLSWVHCTSIAVDDKHSFLLMTLLLPAVLCDSDTPQDGTVVRHTEITEITCTCTYQAFTH